MTGLQITIESTDVGHQVRFVGELDLTCADVARATLVDAAGSTVVADLSDLSFMDSSGVAALVAARREIEAGGNRLEIRGASGAVRRVFKILGMEDWLIE